MHILFTHNDYGKFSGEEHAVEMMAKLHSGDEIMVEGKSKVTKLKDGTFFGVDNLLGGEDIYGTRIEFGLRYDINTPSHLFGIARIAC